MNIFTTMRTSASGLAAQRTRVDVAASNLANAESTRGPDGTPYRRRDPVFQPVAFDDEEIAVGVRVAGVEEDQEPGRQVYLPGHPDASPEGFVTLPNVDPVAEVVNLVSARRGYEANATALETSKAIAQRAIDILT
ncbi:MAG: flagellar basal body rod protein FlgC [Myxococcota bacterium]